VFAFTAEDLAVVGEVVIARLKEISKNRTSVIAGPNAG
jgi:hypothetical protein